LAKTEALAPHIAGDASTWGEEDAFKEHLMDEASTRGTEGDADGHLALAAISSFRYLTRPKASCGDACRRIERGL
jgi:hypothetical protein